MFYTLQILSDCLSSVGSREKGGVQIRISILLFGYRVTKSLNDLSEITEKNPIRMKIRKPLSSVPQVQDFENLQIVSCNHSYDE